MPLPRAVAKFNRVATNRVLGKLAGRVPGFVMLHHVGRKSGKPFRTPVNAFRRGDTVSIVMTYGPGSDWVKNVLAAGGCEIELRGRRLTLRAPRIVEGAARRVVPWAARPVVVLARIRDVLELTVEPD
jgi:deazaflavin-dependent oxidoreductase (nitroreductase family)